MGALFRYTFAVFARSQRYVAPAGFFLALLTILTSSDSGPLLGVYAASAGSLLAASTWLGVAVVNVEDPVSRDVVVVNAGRSREVLVAAVGVAAVWACGLAAVGLVYPVWAGRHTVTAVAVLVGFVAELGCAFVGIGIGLLCSRLVVGGRAGVSVLAGTGLVLGALLTKGVSPVYVMLRDLASGRSAGSLLVPVTGWAAVGALVLGVAVVAVEAVGGRKG